MPAFQAVLALALAIGSHIFAAVSLNTLPDPADDITFLDALHDRGLDAWAQQYVQDIPANDDVGKALARRYALLNPASDERDADAQRTAVTQASEILVELIRSHPEHPARFRWQIELARDYLERQRPTAFESLLTYEVPGRDRAIVKDLGDQAVQLISQLRDHISNTWKSLESLDEDSLTTLRMGGSLALLESFETQSAMLLTWARLYKALASEPDAAVFSDILAEVNRSGWLDLPAGRESEQAGALLIAAVAERRCGRFDDADAHARRIIALLDRIKDRTLRQRLRQVSLLAVLEQIRATRDAGRYDAALQAIEPARQWFLKNRPNDATAFVAVGLLEASIVRARQAAAQSPAQSQATTQPAMPPVTPTDWLRSQQTLAVLQRIAATSPANRDMLYAVLASSLADTPFANVSSGPAKPSLFAVQLLVGTAVADAAPGSLADTAQAMARLQETASIVRRAADAAAADNASDPQTTGELQYLLGSLLALQKSRLAAATAMSDMADRFPTHDRADDAARRAVGLAAEALREAGRAGSPDSRAAFIRAGRLHRQRTPDDAGNAELTFAIGVALDSDGQYEQAAENYAMVPAGNTRSQAASLARLRCLRLALDQVVGRGSAAAARLTALANKARAAVAAVGKTSTSTPASTDCDGAMLVLAMADVLNHPAVGGAEEASRLVQDFDTRFAKCSDLQGQALRQRILALRQLKQLGEARELIDRYLTTDPENAGSVMAGLLQAMHEEITAALQRGDAAAVSAVAVEAVQLGQSLIDWAVTHSGKFNAAQMVAIRHWHAASLLYAGRAAEALAAFDETEEAAKTALQADSPAAVELRLDRAAALVAVGRAAEALPVFGAVWQASPEGSDLWWHALVGSLQAHAALDPSPEQVLASIRQQRFLSPDLGGGRWRLAIESLEKTLSSTTKPAEP